MPSKLKGEGLKQGGLPSADPVSHESEWNPSVICLQSGQQDGGRCHGDPDMLNRLHTHGASAAGNWMQALNFGILPKGRQKTMQMSGNPCIVTTLHGNPCKELHCHFQESKKHPQYKGGAIQNALQAQLTWQPIPAVTSDQIFRRTNPFPPQSALFTR